VFAANGSLANPTSFTAGLHPALTVVAVLSVIGAICAIGVAKPRSISSQQAVEEASPVLASMA